MSVTFPMRHHGYYTTNDTGHIEKTWKFVHYYVTFEDIFIYNDPHAVVP